MARSLRRAVYDASFAPRPQRRWSYRPIYNEANGNHPCPDPERPKKPTIADTLEPNHLDLLKSPDPLFLSGRKLIRIKWAVTGCRSRCRCRMPEPLPEAGCRMPLPDAGCRSRYRMPEPLPEPLPDAGCRSRCRCRMPDAGAVAGCRSRCRMPDAGAVAGCRMPEPLPDAGAVAGCRMPEPLPDAGCRMPDAGCRMPDAGCLTHSVSDPVRLNGWGPVATLSVSAIWRRYYFFEERNK